MDSEVGNWFYYLRMYLYLKFRNTKPKMKSTRRAASISPMARTLIRSRLFVTINIYPLSFCLTDSQNLHILEY